jgi:hypothetical protein
VDALVRCVVMLGMVLGPALVGGDAVDRARRWWVPAAVAASVALWLPRGTWAAALAGVCWRGHCSAPAR